MRSFCFRFFVVLVLLGLSVDVAVSQTVYSGFDVSFSKMAFGLPTEPANQDQITSNVILTRGDSFGIYNIAQETNYTNNSSPTGTAWAFANNNPGETIAATNYAALTFEDWQTSLGSAGALATNILAGPGVLHLISEDIYLDIEFTEWGRGGSGGVFSYNRAAFAVTNENADFNSNGLVEGQDYLIWQNNFGTGSTLAEGDADESGTVDADDLGIWQVQYGSGAALQAQQVPEPTSAMVAAVAVLGGVIGGGRFRRNRSLSSPH